MLAVILTLLLTSTVLAVPLARRENAHMVQIFNKCPMAIHLFFNDSQPAKLAINGNFAVNLITNDTVIFYTNSSHGSKDGKTGTISAAIQGNDYYLISDPERANTGVKVVPKPDGNSSACLAIECDRHGCPDAFPTIPSPLEKIQSPYHQCNATTVNYDIYFCPTNKFAEGQPIHFNGHEEPCLGVRGEVADGTPVDVEDCTGNQNQRWTIQRSNTRVQLDGTNKCLDAGSHPKDGVQLKVWECYDGLPAQKWFYTEDNRIALDNNLGLCADLENGEYKTGKVQTWTCTDKNNNQVWTLPNTDNIA